jgi:hypothetical protein
MKNHRTHTKELILQRWFALPVEERAEANISAFALQAARDFPFDSVNPCSLIRLWIREEMD